MAVEQIFYGMWGQEKEEHSRYFEDISDIAEWIAWGLEAQCSGWRDSPTQMSTIAVNQHKEKYGTVRVYCSLSAHNKVQKLWAAERRAIRSRNKRDGTDFPLPEKGEFLKKRDREDAKWYRYVYRKAVACWPHYERAITAAAEYPHLLMSEEQVYEQVVKRAISKLEGERLLSIIKEAG